MTIRVFIGCNHEEFLNEIEFIIKEISGDSLLDEFFVFENDSVFGREVFINKASESDIFIGLIGSKYGNIYRNNHSASEFEYDLYSSRKNDSYFFVKNVENKDEGSIKFLNRISKVHKYKTFDDKYELITYVKNSLKEYLIKSLHKEKFDKRIIRQSSCEDVDEHAVELFFDSVTDDNLINIKNERGLDKILEYIGAGVIDEHDNFHLNNAGALFFAKDLDKFDIDHEVKMVRFNGNDRLEVIDKFVSKSSFFILLDEFKSFFDKNTKKSFFISGFDRISVPEYPLSAVREAFVNALAHRDYDLTGSCITFYIYDNRIEIISPGNLIYPLTVDTLGVDSNPIHRNEKISNIFSKTKYMEHIGTGIKRMVNEMINSGLNPPQFHDNGFFKVILNGPNGNLIKISGDIADESTDLKLNNRQKNALNIMNNDKKVFSYSDYSKEFNVSNSTAKRDLDDLFDKKFVRKIKTKNYYVFLI